MKTTMSDQTKFVLNLVAINKNDQVKKLRSFGDKLSDHVTSIAGSSFFLFLNVAWFAAWILINTGVFGKHLVFDEYPFGFLTMVVSLEAIILSIFVLISQKRQSERSEIRAEADYITDLQADAEINIIISMLERLASKQDIPVDDLLNQLSVSQQKILKDHPVSEALD
jgi:uncharacterized membrane protein